ncbi:DinB/UmuC family translesion DNA polymerase, partial [Streptomyces sp. NPDC054952]
MDPIEHRRALLCLAEEVAARLRDERQAAGALVLSVRYADRSVSTRSRTLAEATAHTRPLATTGYELYDLLGLQRARVRALGLRAQDLRPATEATRQLTLDPDDDRALAIEAVTDRARARYGPGTLRPAALATTGKRLTPNPARPGRTGPGADAVIEGGNRGPRPGVVAPMGDEPRHDHGPTAVAAAQARLAADRADTLARTAALSRDFDAIVAANALVAVDDEHDPEGASTAFER